MVKFELTYVGYMDFDDEEEAKKFAMEMEESLGFLTRKDLNLYCSELKKMNDTGDIGEPQVFKSLEITKERYCEGFKEWLNSLMCDEIKEALITFKSMEVDEE